MDEVSQISEFGKILIFLISGILMVGFAFVVSRSLSPDNPTPEKLTSYECGEESVGSAWLPFNSRFYVIALIFLLFDVEMVFILPWATVFGNRHIIAIDNRWGWISFTEMFIFLGVLILGLAYVWVKGDLDWIKPKLIKPTVNTQIPINLYDKLNIQQSSYITREFNFGTAPVVVPDSNAPSDTAAPVIKKPMFKPMFKKPGNES